MRRKARLPLVLGLALASSGCAQLFGSYDVASNGLHRDGSTLRYLLTSTRFDSALVRLGPESEVAPDDELLRLLQQGIVARFAGRYQLSNAAFEHATLLAEDRFTKSVSRSALSLLTSDLALPYEPGRAERALIHYYGALNYLAQGDTDEAAVEARRLSYLLEQYGKSEDGPGPTCGLEPGARACGLLRYFAGAVFEAAGQMNDAAVAYRHARAFGAMPVAVPDTAAPGTASGEVLIFVERGFVAHRAEQALMIPILPVEVDALSGGGSDERFGAAALLAARVVEQVLHETGTIYYRHGFRRSVRLDPPERPRVVRRCEHSDDSEAETAQDGRDDGHSGRPRLETLDHGRARHGRACASDDESDNPYLLRIAWPVFRSEPGSSAAATVVGPNGRRVPLRLHADVSEAVIGDFERERRLVLARTLLRAVAKFAVTRTVEEKLGGDDDVAPRVLGLITNLTTALLERADTRSWHLLPAEIGVVRLRLPAGRQPLTLRLGRRAGDAGDADRKIELGPVDVRAGGLAIIATRIWK